MSTTKDGQVVVNVQQNTRMFEIVGTLLFCGSIGMLAYALAKSGWLEIAATMMTMFIVQFGRLLLRHGLIDVPRISGSDQGEFKETSGFVRTALREFGEWQARSPIWRLAALATLYTLTFMLARSGMKVALGIFTNVWVAGSASAFVGALIVFPQLFAKPVQKLKTRQGPAQVADSTPSTIPVEVPTSDHPAA